MKLSAPIIPTNSSRPNGSHRIRIVSCIDNMRIGGTELNALRTAERLDRERFDLSVVCLNEDGPLRQRYADAGIPVRSFRISSLYGPDTARQGWRFGRYLRADGGQIVHTHDVSSNVFAAVLALLFRIPVVNASRRWWNHVPRVAHLAANRAAYAFAHRVLANSESVAGLLQRSEWVDPARILVIPNFVDDAMFVEPDERIVSELRARFGIPQDALVVGTVARLHPVKDVSSLLRAVNSLVDRWPALVLVIVGDGECRPALEEEA